MSNETKLPPCEPEEHEWHELTDRYRASDSFGFGFLGGVQIDVMCSKCGKKATARQPDSALVRDLPSLREGFEVTVPATADIATISMEDEKS